METAIAERRVPVTIAARDYDDTEGGGRKGRYGEAKIGQPGRGEYDRMVTITIYSPKLPRTELAELWFHTEPGDILGSELVIDLTSDQIGALATALLRAVAHARSCGVLPPAVDAFSATEGGVAVVHGSAFVTATPGAGAPEDASQQQSVTITLHSPAMDFVGTSLTHGIVCECDRDALRDVATALSAVAAEVESQQVPA